MANRLATNPIYVDGFDADVTLASPGKQFIVKKIRLLSVTDGDIFQIENQKGEVLLRLTQTGAADVVEVDFGEEGFNFGSDGVYIDVSDCTGLAATDGTDAVWFYMA